VLIQINARNRGFEFEAQPGEKVLHAGLRAGVDLPYECATGTCGTCKAKALGGRVRDGWAQAPGKKYLKAQGEFLMCQCDAEDALSLEVSKFVYPMEPGACVPRAQAGTLRGARALTHDVMAFSVEFDSPRDFDAGQFFLLAPQGLDGLRAYSMCNFGRGVRRLDFIAKRKPGGGFSEWLFGADRDGAPLETFGPLGKATFDPALGKNVLCIAGGSGIAGMMSILARAREAGYFERHKVWLFFGVRTMRDALFLDELASYKKADITVALSEEAPPSQGAVKFERGLVHEVARRAMAGKYQDLRAYVAGPPAAVDAAIRVLLLEAKLSTDNIRYDKYS